MSHGIFIAGTDTNVGKTRVTLALLRALQIRGIKATGMSCRYSPDSAVLAT